WLKLLLLFSLFGKTRAPLATLLWTLFSNSAYVNNFVELRFQLIFVTWKKEIVQNSSKNFNEIKNAKKYLYWWDRVKVKLSFPHLVQMKATLEELKKNIIQLGKTLMMLET
ncbi:Agamous-like MADS-box protein AGL28, partial [Bienertia sinuspersici]